MALTAVMVALTEPAARLLFPRLDSEAIVTVARLTRITLPAQIFFVLGSLLMAYQYAHRRFLFPALAPVFYNLAIIAGGLIGTSRGNASPDGFVWGALVGAALGSFALQWWGARSAGWRPDFATSTTGRSNRVLREYLLLALPLMVGQSVTVLDEQFPRLFGQLAGEGGTAALSFARMLNMLPVGIIAQAAGVATFPFLARLVAGGRNTEADQTTAKALRTTVALAVGAAAVLCAASGPLVRIVFQWGAFNARDSETVAGLLPLFAISIPAWAMHQVVSRWFYAHRRMWLPVITGTVATLVAIPVTLLLFDMQGLQGIAIASTSVMWAYTISLTISWTRGDRRTDTRLLGTFLRLGVAGLAAGIAGRFLADRLFDGSIASALVGLLAVTLLVAVVFLGLAFLFGLGQFMPRRRRGPT